MTPSIRSLILIAWFLLLPTARGESPADSEALTHHFETRVRPVLVERCQSCHGPEEQTSSFRVDSRDALIKGGELGIGIVPGHPEQSPLVAAIRRHGERPMPPDNPLPPDEVDALVRWIETGAWWPTTAPLTADRSRTHWAFQPLKRSVYPLVNHQQWARSPIDMFILGPMESSGLMPSPEADRRSLLRRAAIDVTGLLPSEEEVSYFVAEERADAFDRQVDRLLASVHYGEAMGRRWLDVARYADTKGYVYAREERTWLHSWAYRDWVVEALNQDLPYDEFLKLQLAGDQLAQDPKDMAAMGFLTLGRRFLGVTRDIIDDRIDVVTRGTMGLTVGCARCHDHKYDPISTKDYYSLYGVFDSSAEKVVRLPRTLQPAIDADFEKGLAEREQKLTEKMAASRKEAADRVRGKIAEYLVAQLHLEKYPVEGFDVVIQPNDVVASFARRWRDYLDRAEQQRDSIFVAWRAYASIEPDLFSQQAAAITAQLASLPEQQIHPLVAAEFQSPPASLQEVADRYGKLFGRVDEHWKQATKENAELIALADPREEELRHVLYGEQSPCEPPHESVVGCEFFFTTDVCVELWRLQGEVDRWLLQSPQPVACALLLVDRPMPKTPRVFRRGNPLSLGDRVPRQFLTLLRRTETPPFSQGSGRRELAEAIVDPNNPLTARVIVNRIWLGHFGAGLARFPSDFGVRADRPSHPELLDELSLDLMDEHWSLKWLHRVILTSAAYRQQSTEPTGSANNDQGQANKTAEKDPENRLLSHGRARRLTFEEWRDASLAAAGELDLSIGGRPENLFAPAPTRRRAIYGQVDRQFLPATLRVFDFANPDLHIPQRAETTVPQQALFFLNNPFVIARSKSLAALDRSVTEPEDRIKSVYRRLFHRLPSPKELSSMIAFVTEPDSTDQDSSPPMHDWSYGFANFDPATRRVEGFVALPFFNGDTYQGGAEHPDSVLGWVQLSAVGGHAGNDHQHAAVRRWTAPRDVKVQLRSQLVHPSEAGDGIHAAIVAQGQSILEARILHATAQLDWGPILLKKGESIDFVVDRRDVLNHDEFEWSATLSDTASSEFWSSTKDFAGQRKDGLDRWEQLAQILLTSNEFLFVD
jgi:mono/diheme cytochrome c family protein